MSLNYMNGKFFTLFNLRIHGLCAGYSYIFFERTLIRIAHDKNLIKKFNEIVHEIEKLQ